MAIDMYITYNYMSKIAKNKIYEVAIINGLVKPIIMVDRVGKEIYCIVDETIVKLFENDIVRTLKILAEVETRNQLKKVAESLKGFEKIYWLNKNS